MTTENKSDPLNSFFSMVTEKKEVDSLDEDSAFSDKESATQEKNPSAEASLNAENSDMPHHAKRVLVHLMRQGVIIASQNPKLFELLCHYESFVRRHLSEVFLQLVLDGKSGVAFVASYDNESASTHCSDHAHDSEEEAATLISRRTLTLYDTLILLVLRKHYQERESSGEQKITIDIERLESDLIPFLPLTDHASLDRKKLEARVKDMVKRKILSTTRSSEDRYEITPIIRYVVNASFLESMLAEYKELAEKEKEALL